MMPVPILPFRPLVALLAMSSCGQFELRCDPTPSATLTPTVTDTGPDAPTYTGPIDGLTLGLQHGCALYDEDDARCWGGNDFRQLGPTFGPMAGEGLSYEGWEGPAVLVAGGAHTCAAEFEGVFCWGRNNHGQVSGVVETASGVVMVETGLAAEDLSNGVDIAAGLRHSCAAAGSEVVCWGDHTDGQLGRPPSRDAITAPWRGPWESVVEDIAAGAFHNCALVAGEVFCWGANDHGQLGLPPSDPVPEGTPHRVSLPTTIVALAAGPVHSCALDGEGTVFCWGGGESGELGHGERRSSATPITVVLPFTAAQIVAGGGQGALRENDEGRESLQLIESTGRTCALDAEGRLACWGANGGGQLAPDSSSDLLTPTVLLPTHRFERLAIGGDASCGIDGDGLLCWGDGVAGQTGTEDTTARGPVRTTVFRF